MVTQVEALAKYAARASFADLSAESRRQLPIHILDSLAACTLIGGVSERDRASRAYLDSPWSPDCSRRIRSHDRLQRCCLS
jgi:2-methylcitrate dehydratase PrpD